ncbi:MAG: type I secretion protein TolC [Gammaproteobacteria bacterium]|nr:MAG: type I secretion protein TolC [Gammaproteobacteria bacterium]RLA18080.1 MAG: type I secretion protein TolC [Gammaproteobacteria bacterium]
MKIIKNSLALCLLLNVGSAWAANDLVAIYQQAVVNDPTLKAERQNLLATEELPIQARALLLPSIEATAGTTKNKTRSSSDFTSTLGISNKQSYNSHGYAVTLRQPVYNHALFVGTKEVKALVNQAMSSYTAAEQELMFRAADRYFAVLAADDDVVFAGSEKKSIERQLEQARQRFEVGLIAITDIHEAKARYDQAVFGEIVADNIALRSREALREMTFEYYEQLATLEEESPLVTPEPANIEAWVDSALMQNAGVQAQVYAVEAALQGTRRQRAGHFPTLDIVGRQIFDSANASRFSNGNSRIEDTFLSFELEVPIFEGGAVNSRTREASHRHAQQKDLLEQAQRAVVRETRDSYLNIQSSISGVISLRQARLSSQSALDATQLGFKVGTRTSVDVLDSQRELYRAKRALSKARYGYILNTLRLKQAAGTLKPDDLVEVNEWLVWSQNQEPAQ